MDDKKDNSKKIYEKPVIRKIELAAEEIMGDCKFNAGDVGPGPAPQCNLCGGQYGAS
jgi:hypothetical protein